MSLAGRLRQVFDIFGDVGGRKVPAEAVGDLAVVVHEELLEVPGDVGARDGRPQGDGGGVEGAWPRGMGCVELSDGRAACEELSSFSLLGL